MVKEPLVISNAELPLHGVGAGRSYHGKVQQLVHRVEGWLPRRSPVDYWIAANDAKIAAPHLDELEAIPERTQGKFAYLFYRHGTESYAQRGELLANVRGPLQHLLEIRAGLEAPGSFEQLVRDELGPFFDERSITVRKIEAYTAAQRLQRRVRLYDTKQLYVSIVLQQHVNEPIGMN